MEGSPVSSRRKGSRMAHASPVATPSGATPQRITSINAWWQGLSAPQRRSYCAIVIGFTTFVLLIGLFPFATATWVAALSRPVVALWGWGTPILLLGTLLACGMVIRDAFIGMATVRRGIVIGLIILLALCLCGSRLWLGAPWGGLVGGALARVLLHLPAFLAQTLLWGGLALDILALWRISRRHSDPAVIARSWRASHAPATGQSVPVANPSTPAANASAAPAKPDARRRSNSISALPPLAGHALPDLFAPTPGRETDEDWLDALRVPAYLRRAVPLASPPGAPTDPFALPPLPAAPPDLPTVIVPGEPVRERTAGRPANISQMATAAARPRAVERQAPARPRWSLPTLGLLQAPPERRGVQLRAQAEHAAEALARTLRSLGVEAEVRLEDISIGPTVTRLGVRPLERPRKDERGRVVRDAAGAPVVVRTRVSRIMHLKDDLALALAVKTLRMEAPVPERPYIGIEIPNAEPCIVTLREILASNEWRAANTPGTLPVPLGRDVAGRVRVGDLAAFPHLLIAGATGAGKSACLNSIITALIMHHTPDDVRLMLFDPKMVELTPYNSLPHLLAPVVTTPPRAAAALAAAQAEMERRLRLFTDAGVRDLAAYRAKPSSEPLPRIVIVIDELADLLVLAGNAGERAIGRLAHLARATGIHLIVATQRPSVDVLTGVIKANLPTRIAFMTASATDARVILDQGGAEHLLGKGDMLFQASDAPRAERIQGAFVTADEIARLVRWWADQARTRGLPTRWVLPTNADATPDEHDLDDADDLAHLWSRPRRARSG
jgi:DNA segregation ATPase FtsK/SpoIIIE-like protein